jgi:protocatechuate 3,4-dioxygenase beta subunit
MPVTRRDVLGWIALSSAVSAGGRARSARAQEPASSTADPQFAPPPSALSDAELALLAQAVAFARTASASDLVCDARFMTLHPQPAFRALVRGIARSSKLTIARDDEPGRRIVARGTVIDGSGGAVADAVAYAYHTSAKGWYAADGAHVRAYAGDTKHARLFGYLRTGRDGEFEIRTIRPGGYPRSTLPEHIHLEVEAAGFRPRVTELLFDDDSRLNAEQRERAKREGFLVAKPEPSADGITPLAYTVVLEHE